MEDKEYSTLDIVKALKIPRERLRDWIDRGYVKPRKPAKGQGTKATFGIGEIYAIVFFRNLLKAGISRKEASSLSEIWPEIHMRFGKNADFYKGIIGVSFTRDNSGFVYDVGWIMDYERIIKIDLKSGIMKKNIKKFRNYWNYTPKGIWQDIYIVNFKMIREEIEKAFG